MPNPYTPQQLENTWSYYVTLAPADVVYYTSTDSAGYDAGFSAILGYIFANRLFGFAQYDTPYSGSGVFPGNGNGSAS
jgi:hypothetical protein